MSPSGRSLAANDCEGNERGNNDFRYHVADRMRRTPIHSAHAHTHREREREREIRSRISIGAVDDAARIL